MNIPSRLRSSLTLLILAAIGCPAGTLWAGDVYRYVDAQGHVVYSDQAPPDNSAQAPAPVGAMNSAGVDFQVRSNQEPPALPENEQPPCPEDGYLWTPGYWVWGVGNYYWVPGVWVQPPRVGLLWTPGYWAYVDNAYVFHAGYWGARIGYYGGVNYGFGYFGVGFVGGHWVGNTFAYNRSVSNVNEHVFHNTYNEAVANSAHLSRVSFNGGPRGTTASPTAQERAFAAESHVAPTAYQHQNLVQAERIHMPAPSAAVRTSTPQPMINHGAIVAMPQNTIARVQSSPVIHSAVTAQPAVNAPRPAQAMTPRTPAPVATRPTSATPARSTPVRSSGSALRP